VCWTICGLTSGYLSRTAGEQIVVLEETCLGKGDVACHLVGRTRAAWGEERAEDLLFFEPNRLSETLDVSLARVVESLKQAERKPRTGAPSRPSRRSTTRWGASCRAAPRCAACSIWPAASRRWTPPC
jgi:hypothetical protein